MYSLQKSVVIAFAFLISLGQAKAQTPPATGNGRIATKLPAKQNTVPTKLAAESDEVNPEILESYKAELYEIKKTQDAERDEELARENNEQAQADFAKQIALRKAKVEELKRHQEQITSEITAMQAEVQDYKTRFEDVQGKYTDAETKHEEFLADLEKDKEMLADSKHKFESALAVLTERHDRTAKEINGNLIQVHKLRAELATETTNVQALETQIASLQAEEAKAKAEWMVTKTTIEERKAEKQTKLVELAEAEKKVQQAVTQQRSAQAELASVEKNLAETQIKVAAEVRKYEESTQAAQQAKVRADAGKMRAEAEIEKLQSYLAMVKKSNAEMIANQQDSEASLMSAQVAIEAAKSELSITVAAGDQMTLRKSKQASEMRSIASLQTVNAVMPEGRTWVSKSDCQMREKPRSASASLGEVTTGQRMPASPGPGSWVKVMSAGHTAYIRTECGSFE